MNVPLRQQVFEHVRAMGRTSRSDVARALNISAGSVTALTAELIGQGLLEEVDDTPREQGRGRPPVALQVVPESHHIIGIKLSDTRHTAVLTDYAGNVLVDTALPTQSQRKQTPALMDEIAILINSLLKGTDVEVKDVTAIGVGISGIVDHETGMVPWSPLLSERDTALSSIISSQFGCPVYIDNDANLLTMAELWFGDGRTRSDFAVVTIEQGIGMGLVLNNRLFRGARGMGLELGHIKVHLDGALCRCGQRGCLEAYLADYALVREASAAMGGGQTGPTDKVLDTLYAEAKSGNEAAITIFRRAGRYLSVGLANIIQLFDPGLIIIAGERMRYDYLYAADVMAEMRGLTLNTGRSACEVTTHVWDDLVWARGATALALSEVTTDMLGAARV